MAQAQPRYLLAGETALTVEFGTTIDPALNAQVRALDSALAKAKIDGIIETVPTYRSLMIHFDPRLLSSDDAIAKVRALEAAPLAETAPKHWRIPACYAHAEDLGEVASALKISEAEIVRLHASATYQVYMYGFAPGYVFLGGLPDALKISRRAAPRPPVPKGSLLIAGGQALIGHDPMPTGWYHIGRTPIAMFDVDRQPPCFIEVGDVVRFEPIDAAEFAEIEAAAQNGADVLSASLRGA
ncbi:MAG: 5-oxoprolinase subunit B family protein [Methylovirgula sp.]